MAERDYRSEIQGLEKTLTSIEAVLDVSSLKSELAKLE
ncbi:MAG: hypothetical protein RLZZ527_257, partial [Actinomycetota bacterium]